MMDLTFHSFTQLGIQLPEPIKDLERLSKNFFWSWHPDGTELFCDLDPILWDRVEQHPQKMLSDTSELLLWQKASDRDYLEKLRRFTEKFDAYMSGKSDGSSRSRDGTPEGVTLANPVAYFCAEYGVHQSLPIYSGGLGILAGDHLKSASDLNIPLAAI